MLTFFNKRLHNKKGFTLIELIVVIAILGILIAIAVPRLGGFRTTADSTATRSTERVIEGAAAMYHAEYGEFPDDIALLGEYLDDDDIDGFSINSATSDGVVIFKDGAAIPTE